MGHRSDVKCCQWHPQKSVIVSAGRDNEIKFWDPKSGKEAQTIKSHNNTVNKIKWNMNSNWLISASKDKTIKLYDVRTYKVMHTFVGHDNEILSLDWHPEIEEFFVSGCLDGNLI